MLALSLSLYAPPCPCFSFAPVTKRVRSFLPSFFLSFLPLWSSHRSSQCAHFASPPPPPPPPPPLSSRSSSRSEEKPTSSSFASFLLCSEIGPSRSRTPSISSSPSSSPSPPCALAPGQSYSPFPPLLLPLFSPFFLPPPSLPQIKDELNESAPPLLCTIRKAGLIAILFPGGQDYRKRTTCSPPVYSNSDGLSCALIWLQRCGESHGFTCLHLSLLPVTLSFLLCWRRATGVRARRSGETARRGALSRMLHAVLLLIVQLQKRVWTLLSLPISVCNKS